MLLANISMLPTSLLGSLSCSSLSGPRFFKINHWLLATLFRLFPFTDFRMNLAQFFIYNRLVSGFVFAAACYYFWSLRDERTAWRRARIIELTVACIAAVLATLALRPFIGALPPSRDSGFQQLFPPYLWDIGSGNSFPSHSTLVYFVMAAGLWPISRKVSAILCGWVLLAVSLPRVYIGGHYPSDVAASLVIGLVALWIAWRAGESRRAIRVLDRVASGGMWVELAMFWWLFEAGEGFRSTGEIAKFLVRRVLNIG
ncbi:MAG: phosphatase PAP2 family protein [Candidatus Acidiferrales bacterium]